MPESTDTAAETMHAFAERWNAGDIDGVLALMAEDIQWQADPTWPEIGIQGRDATHRWIRDWRDTWETVTLVIDSVEPQGDLWLVSCRWQMKGKTSGLEQDQPFLLSARIENGTIVAASFYRSREDAIDAS